MVFNRNRIGRVVLLCLYCFLAQPHVVRCGECGGNVCDITCRKGQWCYDRTWPLCNECRSCQAHTYNPDYDSGPVDDASDQCKLSECKSGKKLSVDSKTSKRTCKACDTGKYKEGWNGDQSCNDQTTECGPGQKLSGSPDNLWSENTCSACKPGKYKAVKEGEDGNGDQSCKDQLTECGPGYRFTSKESLREERKCSKCPPGQYKAEKNSGTTCVNCNAGSGVNAAQSACTSCTAGTYSADGSACIDKDRVECDDEYPIFVPDTNRTYPWGGTCSECTLPKLLKKNANGITNCVSETECTSGPGYVGGGRNEECKVCPPECAKCISEDTCTSCTTVASTLHFLLGGKCITNAQCGADMYGDAATRTCTKCKPGWVPNAAHTKCDECPKNWYEDSDNGGSCKMCPTGKVTDGPGKDGLGSCYLCKGDAFQNAQGGECTECPSGLTVSAKTSALVDIVGIDRCTCPSGSTAQNAITVSGSCNSYLNGKYVPEGRTKDDREYFKHATKSVYLYHDKDCDGVTTLFGYTVNGIDWPNRWSFDDDRPSTTRDEDLDGDDICRDFGYIESTSTAPPAGPNTWKMYCNDGWIDSTLTLFHSACDECPPGYFQDDGQVKCNKCPSGYFQDKAGQVNCKRCNDDQFQLESGQSKCEDCNPTCESCEPGTPNHCTACSTAPHKLYLDGNSHTCNTDCPVGYKKNPESRTCVEVVDVHPPVFRCDLACPPDSMTEHAWDPATTANVWWVPPTVQDNIDTNVTVTASSFPNLLPAVRWSVTVTARTATKVANSNTRDNVLVEFKLMTGDWTEPKVLASGQSGAGPTDAEVSNTFDDLPYITAIRLTLSGNDGWAFSELQVELLTSDNTKANLLPAGGIRADWAGIVKEPKETDDSHWAASQEYALDFAPHYKSSIDDSIAASNSIPANTNVAPGDVFGIGTHTILYMATDDAGNYQYFHFTLSVLKGDRSDCAASSGDRRDRRHGGEKVFKTKKRRAEERAHERRKRLGFNHRQEYVVNKETGATLKVYSVGEHSEDMVALIDEASVSSVECTAGSVTVVVAVDAGGSAARIPSDWRAGTLFAIDKAFGCVDTATSKIDSVYRRAVDAGTVIQTTPATLNPSTSMIAVRYATKDASFVDCFTHAEVRYDYHPGDRAANGSHIRDRTQHQQQYKNMPTNVHNAPAAIERERHRRSDYFPWVIKDDCFLGYCYDLGMNYNQATRSAKVPRIELVKKTPTLEVVCIECFAMVHVGLHFYLRIDGSEGDGVKLSKVKLSVVGEARANMNFLAKANYHKVAPPPKQLFDSGEIASAQINIPIKIGSITLGAKASVQLSSKFEMAIQGTAEFKANAEFHRRMEQGIQYSRGEGWSRINPKPIKKMGFELDKKVYNPRYNCGKAVPNYAAAQP